MHKFINTFVFRQKCVVKHISLFLYDNCFAFKIHKSYLILATNDCVKYTSESMPMSSLAKSKSQSLVYRIYLHDNDRKSENDK